MTEKASDAKQSLSDVLNIRVDPMMAREIDRIAGTQDTSASEVARRLLQYGIEVSRKLEASELMLPYWSTQAGVEHTDEDGTPVYRRADITAKWVWERDEA